MNFHYLIRFSGEIGTKSNYTRKQFIRYLKNNIKKKLKFVKKFEVPDLEYEITSYYDRIELFSNKKLEEFIINIFGIQKIGIGKKINFSSYSELLTKSKEYFYPYIQGRSFAVRSHSKVKGFSTVKINKELGSLLYNISEGVNLTNPEFTANIFVIEEDTAWLIHTFLQGWEGFPINSESKAISLFSGGIDSPVASFLTLRKGTTLDFLYFHLGSNSQQNNAITQAYLITQKYIPNYIPTFIIINFTNIIGEIRKQKPPNYQNLLLKYAFYKAAEKFSLEYYKEVRPIITGEAMAQVSTQTLNNLAILSRVTNVPVFRPLLAYTKNEIIALSKKINLYDYAYKGKELCAINTKNVTTSANPEKFQEMVKNFPESLIEEAVRNYEIIKIKISEPLENYLKDNTNIKYDKVICIDCPTGIEEGINLTYEEAWNSVLSLPQNYRYLLVCPSGSKSLIIKKLMEEAGYKVTSTDYKSFLKIRER